MNSPCALACTLVLGLGLALCARAASATPPDAGAPALLLAQDASPAPAAPTAPPAEGAHRHRMPPPQAFAACADKASGAACSFADRRGQTHTGSCFAPPAPPEAAGKSDAAPRLFCRPAHAGGEAPPAK